MSLVQNIQKKMFVGCDQEIQLHGCHLIDIRSVVYSLTANAYTVFANHYDHVIHLWSPVGQMCILQLALVVRVSYTLTPCLSDVSHKGEWYGVFAVVSLWMYEYMWDISIEISTPYNNFCGFIFGLRSKGIGCRKLSPTSILTLSTFLLHLRWLNRVL